jgi:hypothetical protein
MFIHKGNAYQNDSNVPSHPSQNGYGQENKECLREEEMKERKIVNNNEICHICVGTRYSETQ